MMAKKKPLMLKVKRPHGLVDNEWIYSTLEAQLVGVVERYAVLRRKGAMPFLQSIRDLEKWNPGVEIKM